MSYSFQYTDILMSQLNLLINILFFDTIIRVIFLIYFRTVHCQCIVMLLIFDFVVCNCILQLYSICLSVSTVFWWGLQDFLYTRSRQQTYSFTLSFPDSCWNSACCMSYLVTNSISLLVLDLFRFQIYFSIGRLYILGIYSFFQVVQFVGVQLFLAVFLIICIFVLLFVMFPLSFLTLLI